MKLDLTGRCPICLRRRGGNVNHSVCSRAMQKRKLAEQAQPFVWPDGSTGKTKDGTVYTVERQAQARTRRSSKQYGGKNSNTFWDRFD